MLGLAIIEPSSDSSSPLYLVTTEWPSPHDGQIAPFHIKVTDFKHTWSSTVEASFLEMIRPEGVDKSKFDQLTFTAFNPVSGNSESPFLTCSLSSDQTDLTIFWKLKQKEGFQVVLGSAKLAKMDASADHHPLIPITHDFNRLTTSVSELEKRTAELSAANSALQTQLRRTEAEHLEWEAKVFTRFKDVLNAKKRKIRALMSSTTSSSSRQPSRKEIEPVGIDSVSTGEDTDITEMGED